MFRRLLFSTIALVLGAMLLAPYIAVATTTTEMCASFGDLANTFIRARDRGVPLSTIMKNIDKSTAKNPDDPAGVATRWLALFVYDMSSYTEASWIRNRAELKCFQTLQP